METPINVATTAEKRPVYRFQVYVRIDDVNTHKDKYSNGICFPAVGHLFILVLCPIEIHGESKCPDGSVKLQPPCNVSGLSRRARLLPVGVRKNCKIG